MKKQLNYDQSFIIMGVTWYILFTIQIIHYHNLVPIIKRELVHKGVKGREKIHNYTSALSFAHITFDI